MKERHLYRSTSIDQPLDSVFDFFSEAVNLELITPPWLRFEILNPESTRMRAGSVIDYRIHLHGLALRWQSEITVWEPPYLFVDEQRRGPYRSWRHEHRFVEGEGGTEVIDEVTYSVYGGALIERLFVSSDLKRIFDYRQLKIRELLDPLRSRGSVPPSSHDLGRTAEIRA